MRPLCPPAFPRASGAIRKFQSLEKRRTKIAARLSRGAGAVYFSARFMIPDIARLHAGHAREFTERLLGFAGTYVLMCALIILSDIRCGPHLLLAITFVIPVALAAWYRGFRFAMALAIALVVCRIPVAVLLKQITPLPYAIANAAIRIAVLWLVAKLVTTTGRHTKELEKEVNELEGMLPICANCKKIRDEKNEWQPIEQYISKHSEASFTHGVCPDCLQKHYGISPDDPNGAL